MKFGSLAIPVVPLSGKRRIKIESINTAIKIQNVEVKRSDIIVCDDTGVVAVPAGRSEEVLEEAG
jgi:regulator of RNase E activity RraA